MRKKLIENGQNPANNDKRHTPIFCSNNFNRLTLYATKSMAKIESINGAT